MKLFTSPFVNKRKINYIYSLHNSKAKVIRRKKKIKKVFSKLFKAGKSKEKLKCFYYNLFAKKGIRYYVVATDQSFSYRTVIGSLEILSTIPLYSISNDFTYYTYFKAIKAGDTVLDLGSNDGYLSTIFSKTVGAKGEVHSMEPDDFNIKTQKHVFALNKVVGNIQIHDVLIWNENTKIPFNQEGTVASSAHYMGDGKHVVEKEAITLDSWCKKYKVNQLDFIKMDIEGAEIEAIEGAKETIKKFQPHFAIASYHIINGEPTYIKLEKMFSEMGYPYITKRFGNSEIITFAGPNLTM